MEKEKIKDNRFIFHEIELADWKSYCIMDTQEDKVVCNFLPQNGTEYCKELGNKIVDFLNNQ